MSLTELIIILFISIGIIDKKRFKKYIDIFLNINQGPSRRIVGDASLDQKWQWIENEEE